MAATTPAPAEIEVPSLIADAAEVAQAAQETLTVLAGLLERRESRAGGRDSKLRAAVGLLCAGQPRSKAALVLGRTPQGLGLYLRNDAELLAIIEIAEGMGTAHYETELYRRAMAGAADRGSVRALEIVLKARDPQYRDRLQVQHSAMLEGERAVSRLTSGWADDDSEAAS